MFLTTVKVQNWDKTITTIPAHALVSDAFKNWRGMSVWRAPDQTQRTFPVSAFEKIRGGGFGKDRLLTT